MYDIETITLRWCMLPVYFCQCLTLATYIILVASFLRDDARACRRYNNHLMLYKDEAFILYRLLYQQYHDVYAFSRWCDVELLIKHFEQSMTCPGGWQRQFHAAIGHVIAAWRETRLHWSGAFWRYAGRWCDKSMTHNYRPAASTRIKPPFS